jgi:zinc D-Ala-D-Ala carboxypeptidase
MKTKQEKLVEPRRLSTHFTVGEFIDPHEPDLPPTVSPRLLQGLEKFRALLDKPVIITSGWRSTGSNREIGGSPTSQHVSGKAADITVRGVSVIDMYRTALLVPEFREGGIGVYPEENFIHVDVRGWRARWARLGKEYTQIPDWFLDASLVKE